MLENTPKTFNARFEKEVMWAIADLIGAKYGRDKTEAVGRAILEAKQRLDGGGFPAPTGGAYTAGGGTFPQESGSQASVAEQGFSITCRHCGEEGARGPTKYGTICFGCKKDGHSNSPADCPVCTSGSAI